MADLILTQLTSEREIMNANLDAIQSFASETNDAIAALAAAGDSGSEKTVNKGQPNGYASLGADGKVPTSQLPAAGGSGDYTMESPGYFFPDQFLFDCFDPSNIDPRAGTSKISLCTSWKQFYLPWNIVITRYRFQIDGIGGATGAFFYAGLCDNSGNLLFDIGKIDLSPGSGQYGTGAVHDPGTRFFDASRTPQNSIALTRGWHYYVWGAEVASGGPLVVPQMGANNALWDEQVNIDTVGLTNVAKRWAHSAGNDIVGGHLPTSIGTSGGGTTAPPNITFFA
jgi:hypothetical protein